MDRCCRRIVFFLGLGLSFLTAGCGSSNGYLRLVNAYSIAPPPNLDMLVDSKDEASAVGFGSASSYLSFSSGSHHVQAEVSGTSSIVGDQNYSVSSGTYTTAVQGFNSTSGTPVLSFFTDSHTAPTTSGDISIRVIYSVSNPSSVDVYVVPPGTNIAGTTPTFPGVAFSTASQYASLPAGNYQVIFTYPASTLVAFQSGQLSFNAGQVRTILGLYSQTSGYNTSVLADLN
jgi:hypothetical protein